MSTGSSTIAMNASPPAAARPAVVVPLWLLALITLSGTLAMHIFVPALPIAAQDLGVSQTSMQMTLSFYILGLAVGQLIYGPLSDRYGRKSTLMVGLGIYTLGSLAAMLAPHEHALIGARLFQALGGCAGLVLGRAIVRDTSPSDQAVRRLALMNLMITLGPGLAPMIGGALAEHVGWRSIFVVLCGLGVFNTLLAWRLLPETAPRNKTDFRDVGRQYVELLRTPLFLYYAIGGACATTSIYGFISAAPFIFTQELHRSGSEVGLYLSVIVFGTGTGSLIASRAFGRIALRRLLLGSNALSVLMAVAMLAMVLLNGMSVWLTLLLIYGFAVGVGIASPAALTQAIGVNPRVVGSASGLYGSIQMGVGALSTLLGGIGSSPSLAAAATLAVMAGIGQLCFQRALRIRPLPRAS